MAEVKWIKIATEVFDNRKIKQIERMPEGDAIIVVWFKLLCLAGTSNKNGMVFLTEDVPYTEEMLAIEFGMEQSQRFNVLKLALRTFQQFGMIEIIENVFYISSWEKYQNTQALEKLREQTRQRVAKHRDNQKLLQCNVTVTHDVTENVTPSNATDIDIESDKDIDIYNVQNDCTVKVSKKEIEDFFERLWKLYPNKKGKGQISDTKKEKLHKIGIDELTRAIERYKSELAKDDWRKEQNGSTFFNSGYEDYLDTNFVPGVEKVNNRPQNPKTNQFTTFPQRDRTAEQHQSIEDILAGKGL